MFVLEDADGEEQALKPMSCPNSILIYKNKIRSYRDLPLRFNDVDAIHRNEGAASLHGLLRVRVFHQDDLPHGRLFLQQNLLLSFQTVFHDDHMHELLPL